MTWVKTDDCSYVNLNKVLRLEIENTSTQKDDQCYEIKATLSPSHIEEGGKAVFYLCKMFDTYSEAEAFLEEHLNN